jgi:hypothetical protein
MKQPLTHLGTTPSGKKVFLEKLPHEYPRFSKSDHLYAAVLHGANRTRGGAVADLHRLAAGDRDRGSRSGRAAHATKKDFDWSSFTDGAAFGFWASPYVSEVENLAEESREAYRALSPGSGGKWASVMPKTPPSAEAAAKKFTKAVKAKLTDAQLSELSEKFSAHDAGYYGAMQAQGEGVGWFDEGVRLDPPRGFEYDPKIQNAVASAIAKGAREAGVKLPRR